MRLASAAALPDPAHALPWSAGQVVAVGFGGAGLWLRVALGLFVAGAERLARSREVVGAPGSVASARVLVWPGGVSRRRQPRAMKGISGAYGAPSAGAIDSIAPMMGL
jgi:hypothetical protein